MIGSEVRVISVLPECAEIKSDVQNIQDEMHLPSHDLWMTCIKNVHVIPGKLSPERFCNALSRCLRLYRPACGRLRRDLHSDSWKIHLDDLVIPLEVVENGDLHPPSSWVIQDEITPFLSSTSNLDSLLCLKMTITKNQTLLGVSWHHSLGDATTLLRFMRSLSQIYQGLPLRDPVPDFSKYHFPAPTEEEIAEQAPAMPHLVCTYPTSEIGQRYRDRNQKMATIRFMLQRTQTENLMNWVQNGCTIKLTTQDCITACIAVILNLCQTKEHKITKITNAATYRGISAPWASSALAGNPIYIVPTDELDLSHATDIRYIAQQVRQSLINARQPDFVQRYMSVAGHFMSLAAKDNKQFFFGSDLRTMSVNSNLSLDWHSIHFGYPGLARFHTAGVSMYYLRVFSANPVDSAQNLEEGVEVSFGVPEEMEDQVLKILEDVKSGHFDVLA
ncbi:hypothetical protein K435DRAFT_741662 [Dendrothele bispora CBS 962.96]|uniref:CoA-dependent acyltransferase n=1 Tax=Dendrothele bispora (strain CBS 962.96) TaxID=1314807 RepID=A0A4S8MY66_DENBC|nr:hypothetical protein K435DRAFT_741662 [Dendrothele bispora CBS 962.96]